LLRLVRSQYLEYRYHSETLSPQPSPARASIGGDAAASAVPGGRFAGGMDSGAGAGRAGRGAHQQEDARASTTKRYFEGELRALREKLGAKDVSLAKASRIQKELRWSLELYNRELAMIRGSAAGSRGLSPPWRASPAPRAGRSPPAFRASASPLSASASGASTHSSTLGDVGAASLWHSPVPARDAARAASATAESPAPVPPPRRRRVSRQGALVVAGAGRSASPSAAGGRRRARAARSSSSSSVSPRPGRGRNPAHQAVGSAEPWRALLGAENKGLALALRAAVSPSTSVLRASPPGGVGGSARGATAAAIRTPEPIDHSRSRWSPPASLSPSPSSRRPQEEGRAIVAWEDVEVGAERRTGSFSSSFSSVGMPEATDRIGAEINAKVDFLISLRREREALESAAVWQRQVACVSVCLCGVCVCVSRACVRARRCAFHAQTSKEIHKG